MGRIRPRRGLTGRPLRLAVLAFGLLASLPAPAQRADLPADTTDWLGEPICERAGRLAERTYALPAGILLAIGRVESGRWDPAQRRIVPWPWAIDVDGNGTLLDSRAAAIARTAALRAAGTRNIDVGCFQIDLTSHPTAFASLDQAFDPFANADYAGRFLASLHARTGAWDSAVAAYHSSNPALGIPYRERVFAGWDGRVPSLPALPVSAPLVVKFASGAIMRVWTPGNVSPSSGPDAGAAADRLPLPRVIVGSVGQR